MLPECGKGFFADASGACIAVETYLINFLEEDPYALIDKGSRPWIDLRKKVIEYVNGKGGNATMGEKIEERPDYDLIKDILDGKVPISELNHCE